MENWKKHTTRNKIKISIKSREKNRWTRTRIKLIKIEKIHNEEGIHLIDVIMGICPGIAIKLVEILLTISDK